WITSSNALASATDARTARLSPSEAASAHSAMLATAHGIHTRIGGRRRIKSSTANCATKRPSAAARNAFTRPVSRWQRPAFAERAREHRPDRARVGVHVVPAAVETPAERRLQHLGEHAALIALEELMLQEYARFV